MSLVRFMIIAGLITASAFSTDRVYAGPPQIHFDLPPLAPAEKAGATEQDGLVTIQLKLSSMIAAPVVPRIDQWLVQCQPRDAALSIADYSPRTEVASEIAGPIQVKKSSENTTSLGVALDGAYGHLARIHSGVDHTAKDIDSYQMERVAPVQAVTASGTINRGRGVYYKLRWTAQQVLEGEKTFRLTLKVPPKWRGSLIDVTVIAQSERKTFGGLDSEIETLGRDHFLVAAYRSSDAVAADRARQVFDAEHQLRAMAQSHAAQKGSHTLTSLIKQVAVRFETDRSEQSWFDRLLVGQADPHMDKEIQKLPMPLRVAVLEYIDLRDDFLALNRQR